MITTVTTKQDAAKVINDELLQLRQRIIDNHLRAGQKASGRTIQSLRVEASEDEGTLYGRKAFGTLETGRRGGRVPAGFYQIILQWVRDKGIQVEKPKTFAYFVARKIAREGTSLYRQGGRADIYSNEIPKTTESIEKRIMALFAAEVESINLNSKSNEE